MTTLNNNNIREDAILKGKVKDVLLRSGGSGALVNVLLDFNARDAAAVQEQNQSTSSSSGSPSSCAAAAHPGLTHRQFIAFLADYGVELSPFEQQYLCRSFDDHGSGTISAATFTRHLTGLNERRLRAVQTAWAALEKNSGGDAEVTRDVLLSSYANAGSEGPRGPLATTFSSAQRQGLKAQFLSTSSGGGAGPAAGTAATTATEEADSGNTGGEDVSYAEFVAFYAGISAQFGTDEAFVAHVLKAWSADSAARPTLGETAREWGPDGDPLAVDGPLLVQDALNPQLGLSSKSYNYSHMQREHPPVEPLPPLHRPDIMATTTQKTYVRYGQEERTLANPLSTRRGQAM